MIFISYSSKDRQAANAIVNVLESRRIPCWIDYRDGLPGKDFSASIVRAIKGATHLVLIVSQNSTESVHVLNEVNSATNAGVPIIPFKLDESMLTEGFEYYIGRTHWLEAITPPLESHIEDLANTIESSLTAPGEGRRVQALPEHGEPNALPGEIRMARLEELLATGYTTSKIAMQLVENDYINCETLDEASEGSPQQWERFLSEASETFRYAMLDNEIVGNWSITALNDESYNRAKRGELMEGDIEYDDTPLVFMPGHYNGYILAIGMLPGYRNARSIRMLVESFLQQVADYKEMGILFDSWLINAFSKDVERLVASMGFDKVCDHSVKGQVYELTHDGLLKLEELFGISILPDDA